MLLHIVLLYWR